MKKEKMLIQLDEDFRMVNDPNNIILERRFETKDKDTGEIINTGWRNDGNYTSVKSLLHGYLRKSIIKSAAQSLEELAEDVKRIESKIEEFIGGNA